MKVDEAILDNANATIYVAQAGEILYRIDSANEANLDASKKHTNQATNFSTTKANLNANEAAKVQITFTLPLSLYFGIFALLVKFDLSF